MTLYDLAQGEKAVITRVRGHGSFRKRITEMGFVIGKEVEVVKKAPLRDPVEYKILDYFVSLRNSEAQLIEISTEPTPLSQENHRFNGTLHRQRQRINGNGYGHGQGQGRRRGHYFHQRWRKGQKNINIALVGNPNSGKTTIFNNFSGLSERVGNYGGVTVGAKETTVNFDGYHLNIVDLPGTYSITAYSPEELFVREFILDYQPDVVINVLDAGNIERNLYLTTQLIDMDIKVVAALNMYDELKKNGDKLNYQHLSEMLGIPFVPTVGNRKIGIHNLFRKVIDVYEDRDETVRHIHIHYGKCLEKNISLLEEELEKTDKQYFKGHVSPRFLSIKLLENDSDALQRIQHLPGKEKLLKIKDEAVERLQKMLNDDSETLITDAKYAFIAGALKETLKPNTVKRIKKSELIDVIITHKFWGLPIFALFMWLTFYATFTLGAYPMDWIETGVNAFSVMLQHQMADGMLKDLLIDGIIGGVGGVLVFLPNIVILYFFISLMEDTGYMARAVFIMDRLMHKIGLHGKSFIPMLMGFGCNVPAIMATRTIESKRDRLITMLIIPFMSCSARLPVYILFITAFFDSYQATILFGLYALGVAIAVVSSLLFTKTYFKKADLPFVMELPPYRMPTMRSLLKHMWDSAQEYLKKIAGVILIASVIIWALGYFPMNIDYSRDYENEIGSLQQNKSMLLADEKTSDNNYSIKMIENRLSELELQQKAEQQEKSYIGQIGNFIQPVMEPLGFDWKMTVGILAGVAAKEVVVGTLGVLYQDPAASGEGASQLTEKIKNQIYVSGPKKGQPVITPLVAFSYMIFILIYFPCVAVIAAIRRESGSWKFAAFEVFYTTFVAWLMAFMVYQGGTLIF
jgi:ferrous iron transport protein B